jgi:hypothetical protein
MDAGTDPHPRRRRGHHRITNPAQPPTLTHTPHTLAVTTDNTANATLAVLTTTRYHSLPLTIRPAAAHPGGFLLDFLNDSKETPASRSLPVDIVLFFFTAAILMVVKQGSTA